MRARTLMSPELKQKLQECLDLALSEGEAGIATVIGCARLARLEGRLPEVARHVYELTMRGEVSGPGKN
jgi:hypothetical protein